MSTADHYQDPRVQEAATRLLTEFGRDQNESGIARLGTPQRLQLIQALLTNNKLEWLENLLTRRRVKFHVYHCSSRAARQAPQPGSS